MAKTRIILICMIFWRQFDDTHGIYPLAYLTIVKRWGNASNQDSTFGLRLLVIGNAHARHIGPVAYF